MAPSLTFFRDEFNLLESTGPRRVEGHLLAHVRAESGVARGGPEGPPQLLNQVIGLQPATFRCRRRVLVRRRSTIAPPKQVGSACIGDTQLCLKSRRTRWS